MSIHSEKKGQKRPSDDDSVQLRWLEESIQRERDLKSENRSLRVKIDHLSQELIEIKEEARKKVTEAERHGREEIERQAAAWDEARNELLEDAKGLMEEAKENQKAFCRRLAAAHEELNAVNLENSRLTDEIRKILLAKNEKATDERSPSHEDSAVHKLIQRDHETTIGELRNALTSANRELQRVANQKKKLEDYAVLQEKYASLDNVNKDLQQRISSLLDNENMVSRAEEELKSWEKVGGSPKEVERRLDDLNNSLCAAEVAASDARIEARKAEGRESELKEKLIDYEKQLTTLKHQNEQFSRAAKVNESKAIKALQERGSLLEALKFYEDNLGMKTPPRLEFKHANEKGQDWEKIVDDLQNSIGKKDLEIQALNHDVDCLRKDQEKRSKEEKAMAEELDRVTRYNSILENRLGAGEFNSSYTKVVKLAKTPEVHQLEAKIKTLEARLSDLDQGKESKEVQQLLKKLGKAQGEIEDLIKKEERYKQAFRKHINRFRQACFLLFAYDVKMQDDLNFSLTSAYDDESDDSCSFQFQLNADADKIELKLPEDWSTSVKPDIRRCIDTFIFKMKAVPCFLANLTMEKYNQQTMTTS